MTRMECTTSASPSSTALLNLTLRYGTPSFLLPLCRLNPSFLAVLLGRSSEPTALGFGHKRILQGYFLQYIFHILYSMCEDLAGSVEWGGERSFLFRRKYKRSLNKVSLLTVGPGTGLGFELEVSGSGNARPDQPLQSCSRMNRRISQLYGSAKGSFPSFSSPSVCVPMRPAPCIQSGGQD